MKICLTSDWHIDASTAGIPRLEELHAYLEALREAGPFDYLFHLGDFFDPGDRLGPLYTKTIAEAARFVQREVAERSVWIAGNHDIIETEAPVSTVSFLEALADDIGSGIHFAGVPKWIGLPDIGVLCLPYVSKAFAKTEAHEIHTRIAFSAAETWKKVDPGLRPLAVIGHLTVPGAKMGSESYEMARGRDIDFPSLDVRELDPAFVANGHYHEAQIVNVSGLDIIIPGSPHRFTFGERDDADKGFTVIEL